MYDRKKYNLNTHLIFTLTFYLFLQCIKMNSWYFYILINIISIRSIRDIAAPIEHEIEDTEEIQIKQKQSDDLDGLLCINCRSKDIEKKYQLVNIL